MRPAPQARRPGAPRAAAVFMAFTAGLALALAPTAAARAGAFSGNLSGDLELGLQGAAAADAAGRDGLSGSLRLRWERRWGDFEAELHYLLSAPAGSAAGSGTVPGNPLALSWTHVTAGGRRLEQRIDRLSIGWSRPGFVLRIGRQALTWGTGTVFHPMDIVSPSPPAATATGNDFKPGTDMIYAQFLLRGGADLELVAVPRRIAPGGPVTAAASTFALRYRAQRGALDTELVLARSRGELIAGLGLSGALGGAVWKLELVPVRLGDGRLRTSGLAGIGTGATLVGRPAFLFAEFHRNGFGVAGGRAAPDALPPELAERLARGQVFTPARNSLALGATLSWSPLVELSAGTVLDLDARSGLASLELGWSLSDNAELTLGAQRSVGRCGSGIFGVPSASGAGTVCPAPAGGFYLRFRQHF